ncbi:TLDc domain-containing protein [Entamoeba marina]
MEPLSVDPIFLKFKNSFPTVSSLLKKSQPLSSGDVITQYELEKYTPVVTGNDDDIMKDGRETIIALEEIVNNLKQLINKEEDNANQLKETANVVVDRMVKKEEEICKKYIEIRKQLLENKRFDLEQMKQPLYDPQYRGLTGRRKQKQDAENKIQSEKEKPFSTDRELGVIKSNLSTLEEWSELKQFNVLFDSDVDGNVSNETFNSKVIGKSNLYYINYDEDGNVFGCFVKDEVWKTNEYINGLGWFMFSLNSNERIKNPKRWLPKQSCDEGFILYEKHVSYYAIGNSGWNDFCVCKINQKSSWCDNISKAFKGLGNSDLTGSRFPNLFSVKRIVVIQMH